MVKWENDDARNDGEVMTIKDVAQYLRISEATVYELARNGSIPALRIGKSWRFQKELLKEWIRKSAEANVRNGGEMPVAELGQESRDKSWSSSIAIHPGT